MGIKSGNKPWLCVGDPCRPRNIKAQGPEAAANLAGSGDMGKATVAGPKWEGVGNRQVRAAS